MDWSLQELGHELLARILFGPMQFRLILQPLTAICLGIHDGRADAKAGAAPFLLTFLTEGGGRLARLKKVIWRLRFPITIAITMDCVVQLLMFGHIRPGIALLFGSSLMCLPYSAARGLSNRFHSRPADTRVAGSR